MTRPTSISKVKALELLCQGQHKHIQLLEAYLARCIDTEELPSGLAREIIVLLAISPTNSQQTVIARNTPITQKESGLSTRIINTFINNNINTYGDLIAHTESDLLRHGNLGIKSLKEIKIHLKNMNLALTPSRKLLPPASRLEDFS